MIHVFIFLYIYNCTYIYKNIYIYKYDVGILPAKKCGCPQSSTKVPGIIVLSSSTKFGRNV